MKTFLSILLVITGSASLAFGANCPIGGDAKDCPSTAAHKTVHKKDHKQRPATLGDQSHSDGTDHLGAVDTHDHSVVLQDNAQPLEMQASDPPASPATDSQVHQVVDQYHQNQGHGSHHVSSTGDTTINPAGQQRQGNVAHGAAWWKNPQNAQPQPQTGTQTGGSTPPSVTGQGPGPAVQPTLTPTPTPTPTPQQVPTPTPQATPQRVPQIVKTPTPTPTPTPQRVPTPTPQATPQMVPQIVNTPTPTPTPTPQRVPTPTPQATPQLVPQVVNTPTPTPTPTPQQVPTPTPQATPQRVPQIVSTPTPTPSLTPQQVPTPAPQATPRLVPQVVDPKLAQGVNTHTPKPPAFATTHSLVAVKSPDTSGSPKIESRVDASTGLASTQSGRKSYDGHVELYHPIEAGIYHYEQAVQMQNDEFHLLVIGFREP